MRRILTNYLSLIIMLSSLLVTSTSVIAETISWESNQEMRIDEVKPSETVEQEILMDSSENLNSGIDAILESSELNKVETDQKQNSEATLSSDKQSRALSVRKQALITVTDVKLTDSQGNPLTNVTQYTDIMVQMGDSGHVIIGKFGSSYR
ncbi:TPA: hypothetical protein ACSJWK_001087 [Listeria monocytogenes]